MVWVINQGTMYARVGDFTPAMMAYTGAVATIIIPTISNGFLLYSAVEGAQQTGNTFQNFYTYSTGPGKFFLGNAKGLLEVIFYVLMILWSAEEIFTAFYTGYAMWKKIFATEDDISVEKGYKWFFMGVSMAIGAWAGSVALGDLMENVLSFFNSYTTKTYFDSDGNMSNYAMLVDLFYHTMEVFSFVFVASLISAGTHYVGYIVLNLQYVLDFNDVDEASGN